jgi:hypothetical protein
MHSYSRRQMTYQWLPSRLSRFTESEREVSMVAHRAGLDVREERILLGQLNLCVEFV